MDIALNPHGVFRARTNNEVFEMNCSKTLAPLLR